MVFPAQAGVFPARRGHRQGHQRIPRASGGVSEASDGRSRPPRVFPAQAGVFLPAHASRSRCRSIPRASGGVSQKAHSLDLRGSVFPAQAGVFPCPTASISSQPSIPRASGGVSTSSSRERPCNAYSPRKRGCFSKNLREHGSYQVFPAQAGVFLSQPSGKVLPASIPRASGGVSGRRLSKKRACRYSPRKRGCFRRCGLCRGQEEVFPAQAGVFLQSSTSKRRPDGIPRASGGVSEADLFEYGEKLYSPRKRGCF